MILDRHMRVESRSLPLAQAVTPPDSSWCSPWPDRSCKCGAAVEVCFRVSCRCLGAVPYWSYTGTEPSNYEGMRSHLILSYLSYSLSAHGLHCTLVHTFCKHCNIYIARGNPPTYNPMKLNSQKGPMCTKTVHISVLAPLPTSAYQLWSNHIFFMCVSQLWHSPGPPTEVSEQNPAVASAVHLSQVVWRIHSDSMPLQRWKKCQAMPCDAKVYWIVYSFTSCPELLGKLLPASVATNYQWTHLRKLWCTYQTWQVFTTSTSRMTGYMIYEARTACERMIAPPQHPSWGHVSNRFLAISI